MRSGVFERGAQLISSNLKFLSAAIVAAALIVLLARAIHTYSARADLTPGLNNQISPDTGQIIPSRPHDILGCGLPISECEKIMMMVPMTLKFSPREIQDTDAELLHSI
jgi:hypothetical protein